ncbi:DNA-binding protein [Aromatoleum evansii]|uniref:DNA-binding protein n=1 Tax=Aromatoleum evansii TaxID=59406 RepID=UPI001B7CDC19|nr:DNA-binding protein [Aromatoleum evansii]
MARFWAELREKSRVRIEHPDLPDTLKVAAGELVGRLWSEAQAAAQENLNVFREEATARVTAADVAKQRAEQDRQAANQELEHLHEALNDSSERILSLERVLAAERAEKEGLAGQLSTARRQHQALEAELSAARKDFASELEKQRDALRRAEDRHEAAEKRALLEIDRERTTTAKAQKELVQIRQSTADLVQRQRDELGALQQELGDVRQALGAAEGSLIKMREDAEQHIAQMNVMREQLSQRTTEAALLQRELELRDEKIKTMVQELQRARESADPGYSAAKLKPRKRKAFLPVTTENPGSATPPAKAR